MYNLNILIFDDIKNNTCHLKELIKNNFNLNIFTASSLDEIKQSILYNNIDLMLVGFKIDDIKCIDLMNEVKNTKELKNIPLFCTKDIYELNKVKKIKDFARVEYIPYLENDSNLIKRLKIYICIYHAIKESNREFNRNNELLLHYSKLSSISELIKLIYKQLNDSYNVLSSTHNDIKLSYHFNELIKNFNNDFSFYSKKQVDMLFSSVNGFLEIFDKEKSIERFNISKSIKDIIELLKIKLKFYDIKLELDLDTSLEYIGVNLEFCQVLLNIINNSISLGNHNNNIAPKVKISLFEKDTNIILLVKDNFTSLDEKQIYEINNLKCFKSPLDKLYSIYISNLILTKSFNAKFLIKNTNSGLESKVYFNKF